MATTHNSGSTQRRESPVSPPPRIFNQVLTHFEEGAGCMSGWRAGGDGRLLSADLSGLPRKQESLPRPFLYAGGLPSFVLLVSVEKYSSATAARWLTCAVSEPSAPVGGAYCQLVGGSDLEGGSRRFSV